MSHATASKTSHIMDL